MLGRIKQTDLSVPVKRDDYFYYTRTEEGKQYAIYCRKHGSLDATEEVLLDGNALAEGKKYFRVGNFAASPNHQLLAYSVDFDGDEAYTIHVKDLDTGKLLADEIPNTYYSLEWANDNATFFYTVLDAPSVRTKCSATRSGVKEDTLVYHETDERFTVELAKTLQPRVYSDQHRQLADFRSPLHQRRPARRPDLQVLLPRVQETEYDVTHHGDSFFIRTNDGAKTFRVVEAPVKDPSKANWKEVLAGARRRHRRKRHRVQGSSGDRGARPRPDQNPHPELSRPARRTTSNFRSRFTPPASAPTPSTIRKLLRFNYTSLVTPDSVFDYNMETRERELKKQQEVLGGYDPSQYQSERIYATAPDGVKVPISLVYKKGLVQNGKAPMLLYGYGAYGISIDPDLQLGPAEPARSRVCLRDRAHPRRRGSGQAVA